MNLREYLRLDFAVNLKYLLTKDKCEFCGVEDGLHLHHVDRFHNLLIETLTELKTMELNDINEYPEDILFAIRDRMIYKQLKSNYKTLCKECHEKIHSIESRSETYQENVYNPYGGYFYINIDEICKYEPQHVIRMIYLFTFSNYNNELTFGFAKKGSNYMREKDFKEVFKLGKTETNNIKNELLNKNIIIKQDDKLIVNKNIFYKGFKPNGNQRWIRFFDNFTIELYNKITPREHKAIGRVISMINLNYKNKILENVNLTDIAKQLNYSEGDSNRFKFLWDYEILKTNSNNKIFLNPNFVYYGFLTNELRELETEIKL